MKFDTNVHNAQSLHQKWIFEANLSDKTRDPGAMCFRLPRVIDPWCRPASNALCDTDLTPQNAIARLFENHQQ